MSLFSKLFPQAHELQSAAKRIKSLEATVSDLASKNGILWNNYNSESKRAETLAAEIAPLKAKIRKQNEADLLLVSMQIQKRILDGEKLETSATLQGLYAQQQAMSNYYPYASYQSPLSGLGQALGIGGMLSGMAAGR